MISLASNVGEMRFRLLWGSMCFHVLTRCQSLRAQESHVARHAADGRVRDEGV
jgi:hypothetical protein